MGHPAPHDSHSEPTPLANRIRNLRIAQGLTQLACANTAQVHPNTWRNWETGTRRPALERAGSIAAALGVPLAALSAPDGFVAVTDVQLTPEAVARVRALGRPEAKRLAEQIASQLEPLILQSCSKPPRPTPSGRGKPRRTRAEVLAGIAEANAMRAAASQRQAAATPGPPEGGQRQHEAGLQGAQADSLTAEG